MARLSRAEIFDPSEIVAVHTMARTNRRCFLMGDDQFTGKNFDHRKRWIEDKLKHLAANFGIDLLAFSCLSNHFHLVLRSRPDVVKTWDDTEVARRWWSLCPQRKIKSELDGKKNWVPVEPTEWDLNSIRNDPVKLAAVRSRLSDISWWMRLLCQYIALRANGEEGKGLGRFWQSRFKAVRILDEESLLACAAYVDLNPIRAALAETLESSDYTSVQRRITSLKENVAAIHDSNASNTATIPNRAEKECRGTQHVFGWVVANRFWIPYFD
jgi:REP element-mobilizing transposase RayT